MSGETWEVRLPEDVSDELEDLPESRVNTVVSEALREALDLAQTAQERRESLHTRRRRDGKTAEELTDSEEPESDVEAKQEELREKIRGPR